VRSELEEMLELHGKGPDAKRRTIIESPVEEVEYAEQDFIVAEDGGPEKYVYQFWYCIRKWRGSGDSALILAGCGESEFFATITSSCVNGR
jgi:hypothetical protein